MVTTIVIPCFNESQRLCLDSCSALLNASTNLSILFVNDGSSDNTGEILRSQASKHDRAHVMELAVNVGKAEAVRLGFLSLVDQQCIDVLGFIDADFATPVDEILRLLNTLAAEPSIKVAFASRTDDGANINRSPSRQLAARVFNVFARGILKWAVTDTQCGAKFFRQSALLETAISRPFLSNWSFDVELFSRLLMGQQAPGLDGYVLTDFFEMPLRTWNEVGDSRIRISDRPKMIFELAILWAVTTRLRRQKRLKATPLPVQRSTKPSDHDVKPAVNI
jgi:dolichyl-phosphate beta-glucosyltransferase